MKNDSIFKHLQLNDLHIEQDFFVMYIRFKLSFNIISRSLKYKICFSSSILSNSIKRSLSIFLSGKDNKLYKLNTKKNVLESVLFCLDNFDIKISSELRTKYQNFYGKIKLMSNDELNDKQNNDDHSIITWKEYESKIKNRFGIQSKEYLMISLYGECNARDDFDLYIIDDIESVKDDITKNYLVRENNFFTICMQHYKTSKNKNPIFIQLSTELNILLTTYIKLNKIEYSLFPTKNGINSPFISAMNKKIDVTGSINTIRHIIISSNLNSNSITPEERVDLANNSFHSINTQIDYKRKQKNN